MIYPMCDMVKRGSGPADRQLRGFSMRGPRARAGWRARRPEVGLPGPRHRSRTTAETPRTQNKTEHRDKGLGTGQDPLVGTRDGRKGETGRGVSRRPRCSSRKGGRNACAGRGGARRCRAYRQGGPPHTRSGFRVGGRTGRPSSRPGFTTLRAFEGPGHTASVPFPKTGAPDLPQPILSRQKQVTVHPLPQGASATPSPLLENNSHTPDPTRGTSRSLNITEIRGRAGQRATLGPRTPATVVSKARNKRAYSQALVGKPTAPRGRYPGQGAASRVGLAVPISGSADAGRTSWLGKRGPTACHAGGGSSRARARPFYWVLPLPTLWTVFYRDPNFGSDPETRLRSDTGSRDGTPVTPRPLIRPVTGGWDGLGRPRPSQRTGLRGAKRVEERHPLPRFVLGLQRREERSGLAVPPSVPRQGPNTCSPFLCLKATKRARERRGGGSRRRVKCRRPSDLVREDLSKGLSVPAVRAGLTPSRTRQTPFGLDLP